MQLKLQYIVISLLFIGRRNGDAPGIILYKDIVLYGTGKSIVIASSALGCSRKERRSACWYKSGERATNQSFSVINIGVPVLLPRLSRPL